MSVNDVASTFEQSNEPTECPDVHRRRPGNRDYGYPEGRNLPDKRRTCGHGNRLPYMRVSAQARHEGANLLLTTAVAIGGVQVQYVKGIRNRPQSMNSKLRCSNRRCPVHRSIRSDTPFLKSRQVKGEVAHFNGS